MAKVKLGEIAQVLMFTDKEGRRIQEIRPLDKSLPSTFVGETNAVIGIKGSSQRVTIPVDFVIGEGITVQQAFKRYDGLGKKAVNEEAERQQKAAEEQMKQMKEAQSQIVRATQMPVGPDGKPLPIPGQPGGPKLVKP